MKISKSDNHDPNYLASVVELKNIQPHPDPEVTRMQCVSVFGNNCIVGINVKDRDKMVYFPVESAISAEFLSWSNSFSTSSLNADNSKKGYFESKGRVKAVKLRGAPSQGYLVPVEVIAEYVKAKPTDFKVGEDFDTIDGKQLCTKYVVKTTKQGEAGTQKASPIEKKYSLSRRLLPNQFRLHGSTAHLGKNIHLINPETIISVSEKLHGCNAIYSRVLAKKVLGWRDKVAKFFGAKVTEVDYEFAYSSRSVLKNRRDGAYTDDVWGLHAAEMESKVPNGFTVYGELVGYTPHGGQIQKNYPYGHKINESSFKAFRVTYTDPKGEVTELDALSIQRFCNTYEIDVVPFHYYGAADHLFRRRLGERHREGDEWKEWFIKQLEQEYLDKPCEMCDSKVVREGVVLAVESSNARTLLKFKSPKFLQKESADRDKGFVTLDEQES